MTTLMVLTYVSLCIVAFRVLRLPASKWTLTTAVLGGVVLVGGVLVLLNYNQPFSSEARLYFYATPISPTVNGQVTDVPVKSDTPVKKGDVLFQIDQRPFEFAVKRLKAELAATEQAALGLQSALDAAKANADQAKDVRDRAKDEYDRYAGANVRAGAAAPFSEAQVETHRQAYLADESAYTAALAQAEQARLAASSQIDGRNTAVVEIEAQLEHAQFQLEQSTFRAPTDGYATQIFLRPGMMAVSLPLRPIMTFVHSDQKVFAAAFRQNAIQRIEAGDDAEVSFTAIPGRVFRGKVAKILEDMADGQLEPSGTLLKPAPNPQPGSVMVAIEITDDLGAFRLPGGASGEVAIYTRHATEFAIIRKILLRMRSWENYLFLDR